MRMTHAVQAPKSETFLQLARMTVNCLWRRELASVADGSIRATSVPERAENYSHQRSATGDANRL